MLCKNTKKTRHELWVDNALVQQHSNTRTTKMSDNEEEYGGEEVNEEENVGSNEEADGGDGEDPGDENLQENTYYNAKGLLEEDLGEAIEQFTLVIDLEEEKSKW